MIFDWTCLRYHIYDAYKNTSSQTNLILILKYRILRYHHPYAPSHLHHLHHPLSLLVYTRITLDHRSIGVMILWDPLRYWTHRG
jgi:hypothetical protein